MRKNVWSEIYIFCDISSSTNFYGSSVGFVLVLTVVSCWSFRLFRFACFVLLFQSLVVYFMAHKLKKRKIYSGRTRFTSPMRLFWKGRDEHTRIHSSSHLINETVKNSHWKAVIDVITFQKKFTRLILKKTV